MKAELKQKWIDALRSGKYSQAKGRLEDGGSYCCLGVLCVVAGLKIAKEGDYVDGTALYEGYDPIWNIFGGRPGESPQDRLAPMNDEGKSFSVIADYIEKNIPADDHSVTEPT